jgi:hypothetical protein
MTATTHAPSLKTTIDQHRGIHAATGMEIHQYHDVTTSFSDYCQERWEDLSADDREYWEETIPAIHEAMVALESLDSDAREVAKEYITDHPVDRADDCPAVIRDAIRAATEE